ncbi:hypothetical protein Hanom_Chr15g01379081 [Helianthus anomalus]
MIFYMLYIILSLSHHFLGIGEFLYLYSLTWCVVMLFVSEPMVFLKATSLSLWIEARFIYISPSSNPT